MTQKIVPHLWFDKEAKEAAEFYTGIFLNSRIVSLTTLPGTPGGDTDVVSFELAGHRFIAISAGPLFELNPAISFILNFDPSRDPDARRSLDETWRQLSAGGKPLMPLDKYPFSERYGWIEDKYGVTWQLMLTDPAGEPRPFIIPSLLFVGTGRAEEAIRFWTGVFPDSRVGSLSRYPAGMAPDTEGSLMFGDFQLAGQWFGAMDSAREHGHAFTFNEAISLLVNCDTQQEIDALWGKLSAVPEAEQCGWIKDKFGVSWQIASARMEQMLAEGTPEQVARVTQAFLPMKKLDVAAIERAYRARPTVTR